MTIAFFLRQQGSWDSIAPLFSDHDFLGKFGKNTSVFHSPYIRVRPEQLSLPITFFPSLELDEIMKRCGSVQLLVSGTSNQAFDDIKIWEKMRDAGARVICLVEQWNNLRKRLTDVKGEIFQPDLLGVVDSSLLPTYEQVIRSRVEVVGSPMLSALCDRANRKLKSRVSCREAIHFISEPVSQLQHKFALADGSVLDEVTILTWLTNNLRVPIIVHPHPIEIDEKYTGYTIRREKDYSSIGVAIGISSVFLYECQILGIPCIAIRPTDWSDLSLIYAVLSAGSIVDELANIPDMALAANASQRVAPEVLDSNRRIIKAIESVLN